MAMLPNGNNRVGQQPRLGRVEQERRFEELERRTNDLEALVKTLTDQVATLTTRVDDAR